ncbi:MAG TPA: hypothetical protein VKU00_17295 [Chthonomonadaceae bacterium]|nr:hypothetical protein [Chthonomonadaceae bacterium]
MSNLGGPGDGYMKFWYLVGIPLVIAIITFRDAVTAFKYSSDVPDTVTVGDLLNGRAGPGNWVTVNGTQWSEYPVTLKQAMQEHGGISGWRKWDYHLLLNPEDPAMQVWPKINAIRNELKSVDWSKFASLSEEELDHIEQRRLEMSDLLKKFKPTQYVSIVTNGYDYGIQLPPLKIQIPSSFSTPVKPITIPVFKPVIIPPSDPNDPDSQRKIDKALDEMEANGREYQKQMDKMNAQIRDLQKQPNDPPEPELQKQVRELLDTTDKAQMSLQFDTSVTGIVNNLDGKAKDGYAKEITPPTLQIDAGSTPSPSSMYLFLGSAAVLAIEVIVVVFAVVVSRRKRRERL